MIISCTNIIYCYSLTLLYILGEIIHPLYIFLSLITLLLMTVDLLLLSLKDVK